MPENKKGMDGRTRFGASIDGYEIFHSLENGYSLTFSGGQIKSREQTAEEGYGVRVLKAGRLGFSYCEAEAGLGDAASRAERLAAFSPKTQFSFAPAARPPSMDLSDKKVADLEAQELSVMLGQMRDGVERHAGKARVVLSCGTASVSVENSSGFSGSYTTSGISAYAEGMKSDGFGFAYEEGLSLPADFTEIGERAGMMAKAMAGAKKLKSGSYTVVFQPTALEEMVDILMPSLSGEWKRKRTSALSGKLGEKVFSEKLSIHDDPLAHASEARPFDDEGTVSGKVPLVEDGVLMNFIYDREGAALEGVDKCGFCSRGHFSSPPSASHSNLAIGGGDCNNLDEELPEHVTVHSMHGSHTANTTTGDFGMEVNVAFHAKAGKTVPVRGFLLSGNIFKLLNGEIYIEKKAEMLGDLIAPRIAFGGVKVVS
jgi:PmbA protein